MAKFPPELIDIILSFILPVTYSAYMRNTKAPLWIPQTYDVEDICLPEEYRGVQEVIKKISPDYVKSKIRTVYMDINNIKQIYTHMKNCEVTDLKICCQGLWKNLLLSDYAHEFWSQFLSNVQILCFSPEFSYMEECTLKKILSYTPNLTSLKIICNMYHIKDTTFENVPQLDSLYLGHGSANFIDTGKVTINVRNLTICSNNLENYTCFRNIDELHIQKIKNVEELSKLNLNILGIAYADIPTIVKNMTYLRSIPQVIISTLAIREDVEELIMIMSLPNFTVSRISFIPSRVSFPKIDNKWECVEAIGIGSIDSPEFVEFITRQCPNASRVTTTDAVSIRVENALKKVGFKRRVQFDYICEFERKIE